MADETDGQTGPADGDTTRASVSTTGELVFPSDFVWGSATSAFQIEGAPLADGKSPSIWDVFCRQEGTIADGSNGDIACDHVNRYEDDVALIRDLGLGAYRFSVSWPRVVPGGSGSVNHAGLDFYDRLVDALLAAGIRPFPTLYHWDLPQVLQDGGGWVARSTAEAFADYAEAVVTRLGDRIDTWTTLNEPFVTANHGYVTGEHAPGHTSMDEGMAASHHLNLAHGLAGARIRSLAPSARLAIVLNFTPIEPATDSTEDREAAHHQHNLENRWYSDPIGGLGYPDDTADHHGWSRAEVRDGDLGLISAPIDLLGVNFYTRSFVSADDSFELPAGTPVNTMGWEIHPPSLGTLLRDLDDRYPFPRYLITENGAPMPDQTRVDGRIEDDDRLAYIRDHLAEVHGALRDGVPIEGYLVWSLFDNFEWAWGYGPRFGIVEVDYETQRRTPKKSAEWFSQVAASGRFALAD
ncbi:MAG: GH1 family beta-glucosidase [Actinomycetota bacterium]